MKKIKSSSEIAKDLFKRLDKYLEKGEKSYWQNKNIKQEFKLEHKKGYFYYDYVVPKIKVCVEFHGDYWHMNPDIYKSGDKNKTLKKTAKQIWQKDKNKADRIKREGYNFFIIWEKDYKKNKKKIVLFLKNKMQEFRKK